MSTHFPCNSKRARSKHIEQCVKCEREPWLLGMTARYNNRYLHYQAKTIKDLYVLSTIYLGLRVASDKRFESHLKELKTVVTILNQIVSAHGEDW